MDNEHQPAHNIGESLNAAPASESKPINTAPTSQPATKQDLAKTETDIEKRMSGFERATLRWAAAMFFITTATAVFIAFQWREMHDAGEQTERVIKADERLATAMEGSVAQAKNAFDAANRQAILSQRAWMQVKVGIESPSHMWTVGQPLDIRIKQKNTGRTPALNLKSVAAITIQEGANGTFIKPPFSYKPNQYVRSGNLTPDGEIFSDWSRPFTAEDEKRILSLKVRVYVHGIIEYDDVFGIHHWLTFCNYLLPGQAFAICEYHNEIDHNEQ